MRDLKPADLTRFSIEITLIEGFNKDLISHRQKDKTDALNLIDYVRKQYNLEDERAEEESEEQRARGNINSNRLYYFFLRYGSAHSAHAAFNTSAITELRNSGSLRLIANQKLVADMADYYDGRLLAAEAHLPTGQQDEFGNIAKEIFSWVYYDDLIDIAGKMDAKFQVKYDYKKLLVMKPSPKLLKTRPEDLTQLYNSLCNFEVGIKNYNFFLDYVKGAGLKLIDSIKNEYDLKDE